MILYPAIDLKDGACVRLERGAMDRATVFNADPPAQARAFAEAGCAWLHVVDLDGAFAGRPMNATAVAAIVRSVDLEMQLGGGIRDLATIERWLQAGVARVILGTAALKHPGLVREACRRFPGRVAVAVGAESTTLTALELGQQFEDCGVAAIVHTDIERDGMMGGANVSASATLARAIPIPVIVSGGISSLDDLRAVKAEAASGIAGAICGRALYDGRLDLTEALAVLAG
jgi:phosphoribosylformimino-5-aminoimidazole carboxamide ribotide isomerase